MQATFTQHALARMAECGISQTEVLATLAQLLRTVSAQNGRNESHSWDERSGQRRLLRVPVANKSLP